MTGINQLRNGVENKMWIGGGWRAVINGTKLRSESNRSCNETDIRHLKRGKQRNGTGYAKGVK